MMNKIKFGTDGWRGIIAKDFTFENVFRVAQASAEILGETYSDRTSSRRILIGYDRRFLAEKFAQFAAQAVQEMGFDVSLAQTYSPTPALSWAVKAHNCLGALVLTASHNPANYLGVKVKGAFGGSVDTDVTLKIEEYLAKNAQVSRPCGLIDTFDPWESYCAQLKKQVALDEIIQAIKTGKLEVYADVMHGAASGGLERLLGVSIREINGDRNPLFDGGAPEPLPKYLSKFFRLIRSETRKNNNNLKVGFVFDGDSDRIGAVDSEGNFLSSQILIPILIEHLAQRKNLTGEVIKTVSGSDLFEKVAQLYDLPIFETAIGYKYIAQRMLDQCVLLGGEESGGIGFGHHIPERDALLSALYVLEAIVKTGQDLREIYDNLKQKTNFHSVYDRLDLHLKNMESRTILENSLQNNPLTKVGNQTVKNCTTQDGYKFRLEDNSWLLIRFSGTEPVLRLYCEADSMDNVQTILNWAKDWANQ
jgi:phosphomannomutase